VRKGQEKDIEEMSADERGGTSPLSGAEMDELIKNANNVVT
jgi:hypothetical protein